MTVESGDKAAAQPCKHCGLTLMRTDTYLWVHAVNGFINCNLKAEPVAVPATEAPTGYEDNSLMYAPLVEAQRSTERCPKCGGARNDPKLLQHLSFTQKCQYHFHDPREAELRKEEVMPTANRKTDTRPSGEDNAGGPSAEGPKLPRNYEEMVGGPTPLVIDMARELYDRFVMGGWEPQDAYPMIEAVLLIEATLRPVNTTTLLGGGSDGSTCDGKSRRTSPSPLSADKSVECSETGQVKLSGVQDHSKQAQIVGGPSAESPWREIVKLLCAGTNGFAECERIAEKVIALALRSYNFVLHGQDELDAEVEEQIRRTMRIRVAELLERQVVALGLKQKRNSFNQTA